MYDGKVFDERGGMRKNLICYEENSKYADVFWRIFTLIQRNVRKCLDFFESVQNVLNVLRQNGCYSCF